MMPSKSPHQNNVSRSEERHSFQKEGYIKRQLSKGEPINQDYLDMFEKTISEHENRFDDPESRENNLEYDLLTTEWILEKVRGDEVYAQHIYAALCNTEWQKAEPWLILKDQRWSCSWRYAGGIVADMREEGDYIDWYCSGMKNQETWDQAQWDAADDETKAAWKRIQSYQSEGAVSDEVTEDLKKLGWFQVEIDSNDI